MPLRKGLDHKLEDGKAICFFNVYVESSQLNSFAKINKIIRLYQVDQYITVIYKENVNTKTKQ